MAAFLSKYDDISFSNNQSLKEILMMQEFVIKKTLLTNGNIQLDQTTSESYKNQVIRSVSSSLAIENMLSLIRNFGFLHLCSIKIFWNRKNFDESNNDYYWVGYSPYENMKGIANSTMNFNL